ncbi:MAG: ATP synthase F1 subunit epsilon [Halobacteriovoraceae bacterium]|nr:ATP synthase F1 subunit epsilon [Halobacteriovoraceae bacterium]
MNYFTVDILTPEKIVAEGIPAESLLIPSVRGQINVLPNHTHIINELATGVLTVFGGADDPDVDYSVSGGICKVLNDKVIVMTHIAEKNTEIDLERAERALEHAQEKLNSGEPLSDAKVEQYRNKAERAQIRIQLAKTNQ